LITYQFALVKSQFPNVVCGYDFRLYVKDGTFSASETIKGACTESYILASGENYQVKNHIF
jgi:hypothetical protein